MISELSLTLSQPCPQPLHLTAQLADHAPHPLAGLVVRKAAPGQPGSVTNLDTEKLLELSFPAHIPPLQEHFCAIFLLSQTLSANFHQP